MHVQKLWPLATTTTPFPTEAIPHLRVSSWAIHSWLLRFGSSCGFLITMAETQQAPETEPTNEQPKWEAAQYEAALAHLERLQEQVGSTLRS